MPTGKDAIYYAVTDPHDNAVMTYWREESGRRKAWPPRATYWPRLLRADIPESVRGPGLVELYRSWAETHSTPWWGALQASIDADPLLAQARFAALTTRCCRCGRKLVSASSKLEAIGPECRQGVPAAVLERLREAVRRFHATVPQEPAGTTA